MSNNLVVAVLADLVAITALVAGLYYRRHFRRDLALAYVALNTGIMAVTALLAGSGAGMGLGLGLFGILSIIRLRSDAISQEEVAYYFVALALGLVNGLAPGAWWVTPVLSTLLVAVMYLADHPHIGGRARRQRITLDHAYPDEATVRTVLAEMLDADLLRVDVLQLDLVTDVTVVDVRFRVRDRGGLHLVPTPAPAPHAQGWVPEAEQIR